jgi:hypothetical protein
MAFAASSDQREAKAWNAHPTTEEAIVVRFTGRYAGFGGHKVHAEMQTRIDHSDFERYSLISGLAANFAKRFRAAMT